MPPEIGDMFGNMAETFDGLDDCGPHELGGGFGPEMPDGFVAGDPGTLPAGDFIEGNPDGTLAEVTAPAFEDAAGGGSAADVLGGAIGGEEASIVSTGGVEASIVSATGVDAIDAAIGAAMDSATDQGMPAGQPETPFAEAVPDDVVVAEHVPEDAPASEDDPTAGLG